MTLKIGWFSTARGRTSRKLLAAAWGEIQEGRLKAEISVVFCSREPGEDPETDIFFRQVGDYGLPLVCLSYSRYRRQRELPLVKKGEHLPDWRRDFDREMMRLLEPYPFDLGVLAGYMLITSDVMCERYDLLNLHPALPGGPKGIWQDVIWQLIEDRAETAGVMMHLATPEVDEGPPVTYCAYPIRGGAFDKLWQDLEGHTVAEVRSREGESNALFAEIRRQGVMREMPLILETLKAFADHRIRVIQKRPVDPAGYDILAFDLSSQVELVVASALG